MLGTVLIVSSKAILKDVNGRFLRILDLPQIDWQNDPSPFVDFEQSLHNRIIGLVKQNDRVLLRPACLHNKYREAEGVLILATTSEGFDFVVDRYRYNKNSSIDIQIRDAMKNTMSTLQEAGVKIVGLLQHADLCCAELSTNLRKAYPELMEGVATIHTAERHLEGWTGDIENHPQLRALAEPVLRLVDIIARNPMYQTTLVSAARANRLKWGCWRGARVGTL